MSIERMKRLWVVTDRDSLRPMLDLLASLEAVHLIETSRPEDVPQDFLHRGDAPALAAVERPILRLQHALDILNAFAPSKRTIGNLFVPLPLEMDEEEFRRALERLDVDGLADRLTRLADERLTLNHRIEEIQHERKRLTLWERFNPTAPTTFRRCLGALGSVSPRMRRLMEESDALGTTVFLRELGRARDNRALVQVVALREHAGAFDDFLHRHEFEPLPLAPGVSVRDTLRTLGEELARLEERRGGVDAEIRDLAAKHRREVIAVLAHHEVRRDVAKSEEKSLHTKRLVLVSGYVRARDEAKLADAVAAEFPQAGLRFDDPAPGETVPVELRTNRFVQPAQFLVSMFGLPKYRAFDPSPFIMFNFLLFFGFCFGDVFYGIGLIALGLYIARRVKDYPGVRNFFTLLAWGGVSALIVGALTGSWAADIPAYFGKDNWLLRLQQKLCILDMMAQPVIALVVALGIGVLNQFYGIVMKMYQEFRRNDRKAALFDGGLWLVLLPGILLLILPAFVPGLPGWSATLGIVLAGTGAVGLVLTQGRNEKSFLAKAVYGVVSLYGILGSYGSTAFIGDTLSYCRLLALGLTTSIVGMSFNNIAGLAWNKDDGTLTGFVIFMILLMIGHVFNFLISILGAFVHSARLIFLEFFGRFYEIGGYRFSPLGTSERVRVIDKP